MFVLVGEHPGDYGDFYQRERVVLCYAEDKESLGDIWERFDETTFEGERAWLIDGEVFIDFLIEELPHLKDFCDLR